MVVAWSGGKDGALAFHEVLKSNSYEIVALLTTATKEHDLISILDVRRILLEQQVKALRIPLEELFIPKGSSNTEYKDVLLKALKNHTLMASPHRFRRPILGRHKKYRDCVLDEVGLKVLFPCGKKTKQSAQVHERRLQSGNHFS